MIGILEHQVHKLLGTSYAGLGFLLRGEPSKSMEVLVCCTGVTGLRFGLDHSLLFYWLSRHRCLLELHWVLYFGNLLRHLLTVATSILASGLPCVYLVGRLDRDSHARTDLIEYILHRATVVVQTE